MKSAKDIQAQVKRDFAGRKGGFRPCAFFDVRLDCIRVVARDCSVLETRINEHLTVLQDTYYRESDKPAYVGFTVKGARHFCNEHNISMNAPIELSALLDAILKAYPKIEVELFVNGIAKPLVKDAKIKRVDIPDEAFLQPA